MINTIKYYAAMTHFPQKSATGQNFEVDEKIINAHHIPYIALQTEILFNVLYSTL